MVGVEFLGLEGDVGFFLFVLEGVVVVIVGGGG